MNSTGGGSIIQRGIDLMRMVSLDYPEHGFIGLLLTHPSKGKFVQKNPPIKDYLIQNTNELREKTVSFGIMIVQKEYSLETTPSL